MIVVISGPGGVGKGTLVARFLERNPHFWLSRSWTTRARRPGEAEDAYHFVTREQFEARIAADGFVEWAPFLDYLQGTPKLDLSDGADVLLEIDVQGAAQIRAIHPDAVLVFVDAPSREEQRRRIEERGDPPERVAQRLERADSEIAAAEALGMHKVTNGDLEIAVREVEAIIETARNA